MVTAISSSGPSGNTTMSGGFNTANGVEALLNNTSGFGNTANGAYALLNNTNGYDNTANGYAALFYNTNGSATRPMAFRRLKQHDGTNTANGLRGALSNTNGNDNTANGDDALYCNTSGSDNTANGADRFTPTQPAAQHGQWLWRRFSTTRAAPTTRPMAFRRLSITRAAPTTSRWVIRPATTSPPAVPTLTSATGRSTDTNIIRIGSGQTQTFIAGVINGNGGGLTNLNASQLTSIGNTNGGLWQLLCRTVGQFDDERLLQHGQWR